MGFIFLAVICIGVVIHLLKEKSANLECKEKYRHPDGLTYTDAKGHSRLVSNDKMVFYTHDKNGDYILEDEMGYVYKNYTAEEKQIKFKQNREMAINSSESTFSADEDNHQKDWICKGRRYTDIQTGEVYVIRYINYKYYYMNISNGLLVRETDWQLKNDETHLNLKWYAKYGVNIEEFNRKQKDVTDKTLLFRNFEYNSSCDYYK